MNRTAPIAMIVTSAHVGIAAGTGICTGAGAGGAGGVGSTTIGGGGATGLAIVVKTPVPHSLWLAPLTALTLQ